MNNAMVELRSIEKGCRRCRLRATCTQVVPGMGPSPCPIMIVGEAPGADEDRIGSPFVGACGRLIDVMLEAAGLDREAIFIANVVRCRPPGNRKPESDEVDACKVWLWDEMKLVDPLVIVAMGVTAAKLLLRGNSSFRITNEVGKYRHMDYMREHGIVVPMFHPSYILQGNRDQEKKMVRLLIAAKQYVERIHSRAEGEAREVR